MFIECGELRETLLILLIYNIGIFFAKIVGSHDTVCSPIYYLFIFFISHFFAAIPMLISKKRTLSKTNSNEIENAQSQNLKEYFKYDSKNSIIDVEEEVNKTRKFYTITNFF